MRELSIERAAAQNAIRLREQHIANRMQEVLRMQREIEFYQKKLELIDVHQQHQH